MTQSTNGLDEETEVMQRIVCNVCKSVSHYETAFKCPCGNVFCRNCDAQFDYSQYRSYLIYLRENQ